MKIMVVEKKGLGGEVLDEDNKLKRAHFTFLV